MSSLTSRQHQTPSITATATSSAEGQRSRGNNSNTNLVRCLCSMCRILAIAMVITNVLLALSPTLQQQVLYLFHHFEHHWAIHSPEYLYREVAKIEEQVILSIVSPSAISSRLHSHPREQPNNNNDKPGAAAQRRQHREAEQPKDKKHQNVPNTTISVAPWRNSTVLPKWMKDYFQWHQDSLQKIRQSNSSEGFKFMLIRCLKSDRRCGGAADRLKPLPYFLLVANKLRRLLFFKWDRPAPLEEFLVPPTVDGMDWRWPPHDSLHENKNPKIQALFRRPAQIFSIIHVHAMAEGTENPLDLLIGIQAQDHFHGMYEYDKLRSNNITEYNYTRVFRDTWYSVFTPSPPVQRQIEEQRHRLALHIDQFHAIHLRTKYLDVDSPGKVASEATKALNCIFKTPKLISPPSDAQHQVNNQTVLFVASDSRATVRRTLKEAHSRGLVLAVSLLPPPSNSSKSDSNNNNENEEEEATLHLDRGSNFVEKKYTKWMRHEIPRYYDTFVDIYLLSYSKCIVLNVGNFGKLANLLSLHPECYIHTKDPLCKPHPGQEILSLLRPPDQPKSLLVD